MSEFGEPKEPGHKIKVEQYRRHRRVQIKTEEQLRRLPLEAALAGASEPLQDKKDASETAAGIIRRAFKGNKPSRSKK